MISKRINKQKNKWKSFFRLFTHFTYFDYFHLSIPCALIVLLLNTPNRIVYCLSFPRHVQFISNPRASAICPSRRALELWCSQATPAANYNERRPQDGNEVEGQDSVGRPPIAISTILTSCSLDVLRRLIAEYNNAAKTNRPIKSDIEFGGLIAKEITATKQAIEEFEKAGRQDLKEVQDTQLNILGEYKNQIKTLSAEQVQDIISKEVARMREANQKINIGTVMRVLFKPGGPMEHQAGQGPVSQAIEDHLKRDS